MTVTSVALGGLHQAEAGVQAAADKIATAADATDSVSLSDQAVALIENRDLFAANIKSLQVADEMQKEAIGLIR